MDFFGALLRKRGCGSSAVEGGFATSMGRMGDVEAMPGGLGIQSVGAVELRLLESRFCLCDQFFSVFLLAITTLGCRIQYPGSSRKL